jgi:hypothetical protein
MVSRPFWSLVRCLVPSTSIVVGYQQRWKICDFFVFDDIYFTGERH